MDEIWAGLLNGGFILALGSALPIAAIWSALSLTTNGLPDLSSLDNAAATQAVGGVVLLILSLWVARVGLGLLGKNLAALREPG